VQPAVHTVTTELYTAKLCPTNSFKNVRVSSSHIYSIVYSLHCSVKVLITELNLYFRQMNVKIA
jgi:hypothetical protein